jgi:hypothetical protein
MANFCKCKIEVDIEPVQMRVAAAKPRRFTYALPYGSHPNYSWLGMGNAKTLAVIREAFADLSKISGAKFVETSNTSKANIRVYFQNIKNGGQYEGNGKIKFSNSRKGLTPPIAKSWVQHEVMHYLGYRASPPADKVYHSTIKTEIYHGDGGGTAFGPHFTEWIRSRYGAF